MTHMKIKSNRISKKFIIIASIVLLVLFSSAVGAYYFIGSTASNTSPTDGSDKTNYSAPTEEEKETGDNIKSDTVNPPATDNPKTPNKDESEDDPANSTVSVSITSASQNGATLQVRTLVGTVLSSGECTLRLTKSGATVTRTAGVQALASASTCQGFDVPISELSPGEWKLNVSYKNNDLTGTAERTVAIQ